jgi:hypothetical protein
MKGWLTYGGLGLLLALTLAACSGDDDYEYPSVVTRFVEVSTDSEGTCHSLTTDEGRVWPIHQRTGLDGLTPDSVYRTVSMYEPLDNGEVQLWTLQKAISPYPKPLDEFKQVCTDPVELTSIWRGGSYLNVVVKAMVKDQAHAYHFVDLGILTDEADGHRTLQLMLYHDRNNDMEGFTRTVYLSVPLAGYAGQLQAGDSICFALNTYKQGATSRTFAW